MDQPMPIIVVTFLLTHRNRSRAIILETPNGLNVMTVRRCIAGFHDDRGCTRFDVGVFDRNLVTGNFKMLMQ
jgi:hypothetical protein